MYLKGKMCQDRDSPQAVGYMGIGKRGADAGLSRRVFAGGYAAGEAVKLHPAEPHLTSGLYCLGKEVFFYE